MNAQDRGRELALYVLSLFRSSYPFLIAGLVVGILYLLRVPDEVWIVLAVVLAIGLLAAYRYMDFKKMKQRTYEAMSPEMKGEIDRERRVNLARRQKFLDAMDKAGGEKIG
jgi:xanthosine utilization system XapX-like protein